MKVILNVLLWKSIHYLACGLDIPLRRTIKPSIYVKIDGFGETRTRILVGRLTFLVKQTCLFRFPTRIERFWIQSHHYHIVREKSTVKDLNKTEIYNFLKKARSVIVSRANRRVTIFHSQEYPNLQDINKSSTCLKILRVVAMIDVSVFQTLGTQAETRDLLWCNQEHGW